MSRHSGGLVPPGPHTILFIDISDSQARLGSAGNHSGGPVADAPEGVKLPSVPRRTPDREDWLPRWVREHVERDLPPADLIDELVNRAVASPSRAGLLEAGALLNELGRNPDNAAHLHRTVVKAAKELVRKEGR